MAKGSGEKPRRVKRTSPRGKERKPAAKAAPLWKTIRLGLTQKRL